MKRRRQETGAWPARRVAMRSKKGKKGMKGKKGKKGKGNKNVNTLQCKILDGFTVGASQR